jgi:hypothetical protein
VQEAHVVGLDLERCRAKEQEARAVLRALQNMTDGEPLSRGSGGYAEKAAEAERLVAELAEHAAAKRVRSAASGSEWGNGQACLLCLRIKAFCF